MMLDRAEFVRVTLCEISPAASLALDICPIRHVLNLFLIRHIGRALNSVRNAPFCLRTYGFKFRSVARFDDGHRYRSQYADGVMCTLLLVALLRKGAPAFDLQWYRLGSFFFIPSFAESGLVQPVLGVGWTLNYEMAFYLAFAVALLIGKKHLLLTLTLILLALNAIGMSLPSNSVMSAFLCMRCIGM